jgi:CDP-4-dehydro-6-deoxyglucose reductase/ferredoxin-NAD(P)+ reductase (naphthalene dioxygenase ferredoxin-specific)
MSYHVQLKNVSTTIQVDRDATILDSALAAGVAYPHGCRIGRCGACKSRLVSGDAELLKHTPFALTAQERAAGMILACRAQPRSNCSVAWLTSDEADRPVREFTAIVRAIKQETHDIINVAVALEGDCGFDFAAGQYAELTFDGCPPRPYSMANRAGAPELEFHIRRLPGGVVSNHAASMVRRGDRLRVLGPFGRAHLRLRDPKPIVALAGGSGLGPITSIVETAVAEGFRQPIRIYFGARAERDIYAEERYAALVARHPNVSFEAILSSELTSRRRTGLVANVATADIANFRGWKAYLAGPPAMVEAASELLIAKGMAADDVHADAFFTAMERSTHLTDERAQA